jgi:hypothetical protein
MFATVPVFLSFVFIFPCSIAISVIYFIYSHYKYPHKINKLVLSISAVLIIGIVSILLLTKTHFYYYILLKPFTEI